MSFTYLHISGVPLGVLIQISFLFLLVHHQLPQNSVASDNNNVIYHMTLWFRNLGKLLLGDSSASLGVDWDTQYYAAGALSGIGALLTCLGP